MPPVSDVVGPVTVAGTDLPPDAPASIAPEPDPGARDDHPPGSSHDRGGLRTTVIDCVIVAVVSVLLLIPALKLWDANLNVPFAYDKDWGGGVLVYERDAPF